MMYRLAFLAVLLTSGVAALAQDVNIVQYDISDGLPSLSLKTLFVDSRSRLWITTETGYVVQYDGRNFERVPGIRIDHGVSWIGEDADGYLLLLSDTIMYAWDGQVPRALQIPGKFLLAGTALCVNGSDLFLGNRNGLYLVRNAATDPRIERLSASPVLSVAIDHRKLCVWGEENLTEYTLNDMQLLSVTPFGLPENIAPREIYPVSGKVALAVMPSGKWHFLGTNGQGTTMPGLFKSVKGVLSGSLGDVWIAGGEEGIMVLNHEGTETLRLETGRGLPSDRITDMTFDHAGQLWIATADAGLCKYVGTTIHAAELTFQPVALLADQAGRTYAIAGDGRIVEDGYAEHPHITLSYMGIPLSIKDALLDGNGIAWILTGESAVVAFPIQALQTGIGSNGSHHLDLDSAGLLVRQAISNSGAGQLSGIRSDQLANLYFVSTDGSVYRMQGYTPGVPGFDFGLLAQASLPRHAKLMHIDMEGRMYFTAPITGNWLSVYNPVDSTINTLQVRLPAGVHEDAGGRIWTISKSGDVYAISPYRKDGVTVQKIPLDEPFPGDVYFTIGQKDIIWVGAADRIYRLEIDSENLAIQRMEQFGKQEGYRPSRALLHAVHTIDNAGQLHLALHRELWHFRMAGWHTSGPPPRPYITGIRLLNRSIDSTGYAAAFAPGYRQKRRLALKPNEHSLGIQLAVSDLVSTGGITYQWNLGQGDTTWTNGGGSGDLQFSQLASGDYTLRVRVCNVNGSCSKSIEPLIFSIAPRFWERQSVKVSAVLATLLLGFGIGRWRRQIRRSRLERLAREMTLKARLAGLEQKALRLQMHPHFLFNVLQVIRKRIGEGQLDLAATGMDKFSRLVRLVLEHSRMELVSLEDELELLDAYMFAENLVHPHGFAYQMNLEATIEADAMMIPPLLIQPFLENAIRHGIGQRENGRIQMQVSAGETFLNIEISDNGKGMQEKQKAAGHHSVALNLVEERLRLHGKGGGFRIIPHENQQDDTTSGGTRVVLQIPYTSPQYEQHNQEI